MTLTHRHVPLSRRNFLLASASVAIVSACATSVPGEETPELGATPSMTGLLTAGDVLIDDVRLEQVTGRASPVPEPATWAFMVFGFLGVGVALRRSKPSVVTQS